MDPVIVASARKHGITDDDMLHAYRHPIRVFDLDDLDMLIGADHSGRAHGPGEGPWNRTGCASSRSQEIGPSPS